MNLEIIDKCLGFASGKKKYQVAVGIRNPDFPQNLLHGNEEEQYVRKCREEEMTFDEIRERKGKSTRSGFYHMLDTIQRKEELYNAWTEFWTKSGSIRSMRLSTLCAGEKEAERLVNKLEKIGVITVGDFLMDCVTLTTADMKKKYKAESTIIQKARVKILEKVRECVTHGEDEKSREK